MEIKSEKDTKHKEELTMIKDKFSQKFEMLKIQIDDKNNII